MLANLSTDLEMFQKKDQTEGQGELQGTQGLGTLLGQSGGQGTAGFMRECHSYSWFISQLVILLKDDYHQ